MVSEPLSEEDGPACDTCGKITCPDADLPAFSEPVACDYTPIYHALRYARDCDYGCARDYTNQAIRLEVVGAVDQIVAARTQALEAEVQRFKDMARRSQQMSRVWEAEERGEAAEAAEAKLTAIRELVHSAAADQYRDEACRGVVELPYASNRYVRLLDDVRALLRDGVTP